MATTHTGGGAMRARIRLGKLTEPGGIAVGKHGELYVTNNSRSPDDGQVLRIRG